MKEIVRRYLLGLFVCFVFALSPLVKAYAGVSYIPKIINYSVSDYKAGNQNWAVAQGSDGKMYIGNNRGLLIFDGIHWTLRKLPNNASVRSLYIAENGRIYVGSFEEFGYFEEDSRNELVYHSLSDSVSSAHYNNDEIWTISEYAGEIYFQSFRTFFVYNGKVVRFGLSDYAPLYFFTLGHELYAQFMGSGFYRKDGIRFSELIPRSALNYDDVVSVLPYEGNRMLLVTAVSGLYLYDEAKEELTPWKIPAGELLRPAVANRAVMMRDSTYIVGTISNGLVAFNKQGEQLWHVNRENGLINNTVLRLYADRFDNLWVAMDNGIAQVRVSSPIYVYEPLEAQIGMVHDMVIDKGIMYLASNQGVYQLSATDPYPEPVPGSQEQTWYITDVGNQLIAGHNKGTLMVESNKATRIPGPNGGGTALRKTILHGKEILLQTSYQPLSVFTRDVTGRWQFSHNVEGFKNLIKTFEVDPSGNIWASHMHKGIYRLRLDETLTKVKEMEYIGKLEPGNQEGVINVMKLRGRIVFSDGRKFYTYEDLTGKIVPYDLLNENFPDLSDTYRIVPLNNDLYWFIRNTEYVLLAYEAGRFNVRMCVPFTLFDNPTIEDRGNIYVDSDGTSYFCLNGGIARYSPGRSVTDTAGVALTLSSAKAYDRRDNRSLSLASKGGETAASAVSELAYRYNNVFFKFSYPDFSGRRFHIFYKLDGFDSDWTEGTPDFQRNYLNLPYGNFVLHAVVKDDTGTEISSFEYPFKVRRPFYSSWFALILYFALSLFILVALVRAYTIWIVSREKKANEEEKRLQEEQLKSQEQLITQLKNDQLENDLTYKSKELASATLSVISHNDFLDGLKKEILSQQQSGTYTKRFFDKLVHMIDENISSEDEWAIFQTNFDRIHENFFIKLKERYPDLTPGDLRLCALLRLNMPTKDMARMQNLSIRGVEAARYRLRKKLDLPEGLNLVDFMIQFK